MSEPLELSMAARAAIKEGRTVDLRPIAWLHFFPEFWDFADPPSRPWLVERPTSFVLRRARERWAWSFETEQRAIDFASRAGWELVLVDFTGPVPNEAAWGHPVTR